MSTESGPPSIGDLPLGVDHLPWRVYFAILVNVAERFSYYGLTVPFQNFVQNSYNSQDHERPGVLGLGQAAGTAITNAFFLLQTIMAIVGAVAADGFLGRWKLLLICSLIYLVGNLLIVLISLPVAIEHGAGPAGFAVSLLLIATGSGGFQSTVSAFIGDQYDGDGKEPITKRNGKMYAPDRDLTLQYMYNLNYWGLNIGAISGIASTFLELHYGFWAAFLLPLSGLWIAPLTLVLGRKVFICITPKENVLLRKKDAFSRLVKRGIRPMRKKAAHEAHEADADAGDDEDVEHVKQALATSRVLLIFILVYVCVGQSNNNFISQAGQMQTNGLPNDLIWYFNPILVVLLLPVMQWFLSSVLGRMRVRFGPLARITVGCVFIVLSMAYASVVQKLIYSAGPCYELPTECGAAADGSPNEISVWLVSPAYFFVAVGEILAITTAYKYAYDAAPDSMKSLVQAILLATQGLASLLLLAISPTARNPFLVVMYATLAGVLFVATVVFAVFFWKDDRAAPDAALVDSSATGVEMQEEK